MRDLRAKAYSSEAMKRLTVVDSVELALRFTPESVPLTDVRSVSSGQKKGKVGPWRIYEGRRREPSARPPAKQKNWAVMGPEMTAVDELQQRAKGNGETLCAKSSRARLSQAPPGLYGVAHNA